MQYKNRNEMRVCSSFAFNFLLANRELVGRENGMGDRPTRRSRRHSGNYAPWAPPATWGRPPPLSRHRRRRSQIPKTCLGRRRTCGNYVIITSLSVWRFHIIRCRPNHRINIVRYHKTSVWFIFYYIFFYFSFAFVAKWEQNILKYYLGLWMCDFTRTFAVSQKFWFINLRGWMHDYLHTNWSNSGFRYSKGLIDMIHIMNHVSGLMRYADSLISYVHLTVFTCLLKLVS